MSETPSIEIDSGWKMPENGSEQSENQEASSRERASAIADKCLADYEGKYPKGLFEINVNLDELDIEALDHLTDGAGRLVTTLVDASPQYQKAVDLVEEFKQKFPDDSVPVVLDEKIVEPAKVRLEDGRPAIAIPPQVGKLRETVRRINKLTNDIRQTVRLYRSGNTRGTSTYFLGTYIRELLTLIEQNNRPTAPETAELEQPPNYHLVGETIRGASHERSGLPLQDAIEKRELPNGEKLVAVADGHGGETYVRSDRGAQMAVRIVNDTIEHAINLLKNSGPEAALPYIETELPLNISRRWNETVDLDLRNNPLGAEDYKHVSHHRLAKVQRDLEKDPRLAYGATAMGIGQVGEYVIAVKLGDGDIVMTDTSGEVKSLFPDQPEQIANETYSLCMKDSHRYFQTAIISPRPATRPMIWMSTDGVSNSYETNAGFNSLVNGVYEASDDEIVSQNLPRWLHEISTRGSGDDVTVAYLRSH